jgi:Bacterial regulatory proteins, gntR family
MKPVKGYVVVPKIQARTLVKDPIAFAVLSWLRSWAQWRPEKKAWGKGPRKRIVDLKPGQTVETLSQIVKALETDRDTIRRALSRLVAGGYLRIEHIGAGKRKDGLLITVVDTAEAAARVPYGKPHEDDVEPLEMFHDSAPSFADVPHEIPPLVKGDTKRPICNPLPPLPPTALPPSAEPQEGGAGEGEPVVVGPEPDAGLREEVRALLKAPPPSLRVAAAFDAEAACYPREEVLALARWISDQPLLERSDSIGRVFHGSSQRQLVKRRQQRLDAAVLDLLTHGASPREIAAGVRLPDGFDEGRYRAHVLAVAETLAPQVRVEARL